MASEATDDMLASFEEAVFVEISCLRGTGDTGHGFPFSVVLGCSLARCTATVLLDECKGCDCEEEGEEASRWASRRGRRRLGWKAASGGRPQDRHRTRSRTPCR